MKIEITVTEKAMINNAIETKMAAIQRAANTEKNGEIKQIREKEMQEYKNVQMKINTQEIPK